MRGGAEHDIIVEKLDEIKRLIESMQGAKVEDAADVTNAEEPIVPAEELPAEELPAEESAAEETVPAEEDKAVLTENGEEVESANGIVGDEQKGGEESPTETEEEEDMEVQEDVTGDAPSDASSDASIGGRRRRRSRRQQKQRNQKSQRRQRRQRR